MQHVFKCILLAGLSILASPSAKAQASGPDVTDAIGGSTTIGGITHEYAIGQMIDAETWFTGALVNAPGVLQPVKYVREGDGQIGASELQIFPDPVVTTLYLQPAFGRGGKLTYGLYDAAGALVMGREAELVDGAERQQLSVEHIAGGQ